MQRKNNNISVRRSRLQKIFSACKIDGLIFFNMSNLRYLTGFTGSDGVLFMRPGQTNLLVDGRYTSQAGLETTDVQIIEYKDKIEEIVGAIKKFKLKRIGLEADSITLEMYSKLTSRVPREMFVDLTDELRLIRACKDEGEIKLMKKAAEISSSAMASLINQIEPGSTEKALAWRLEINAREYGADGLAFETIVAAGENSCLPHARPTERKIKKGDFIVIDFGVKYQGYCSDETCTIAFGKLTDRQKNAYQIVQDAHDRAIAGIKAGMSAADIDRCARSVFGRKYGRYFVHGTGHGVGLEVHEAPRLSSLSHDILKPWMVVTVEPGLYIPGLWGIRIEDTVVVKNNSCEKLTKMNKELTIIE
ncbi:MAG: integrase [Deltaproteobacteria bacterium HGW-Deltaproteobacteria-13]|jgi:Xaa-Pro aminopeptidase/Xaa-Pro dipeptidase|nr:MAG: integrase [Deltaproteobacteria bacterium HGW-Deltaproteobacteria-13]